MVLIANLVHWFIQLFILLIIVQAILSFFMPPYHRVRQVIDRIVNPFLQPIRRFIPTTGGLDFSPMVLIVLLYILDSILTRLFLSL